jgi:hypothetical protein
MKAGLGRHLKGLKAKCKNSDSGGHEVGGALHPGCFVGFAAWISAEVMTMDDGHA